jgi:hypothetical protein
MSIVMVMELPGVTTDQYDAPTAPRKAELHNHMHTHQHS